MRQPGRGKFSGPVQGKGYLKIRLINGGCLIKKDAILKHDQGILQIRLYRNYSLHANHRVVGGLVVFFVFTFVLRVYQFHKLQLIKTQSVESPSFTSIREEDLSCNKSHKEW